MEIKQQEKTYPFLQGGGEMGQLTRNFNWSHTLIDNPDKWPQSLRTTVSNILRSKFPMFLWWGEEMIQFYNDAYRPSLGENGKHPSALGSYGKDTWPEIWDIICPLMHHVKTTGEATWMENQLVPIYRNGKIEDVYWTYSYSSVLDDEGNHGGILVTCIETSDAVKIRRDLQESEARFRNMIEQTPVAIALTRGEDMIFESANAPMIKIINRKTNGEVLGKKLSEVLPELKSQPVYNILQQVLKTGETFRGIEVEADIANGNILERRYFDITYTRIVETSGTPSVMHMVVDVTEQMLAKTKKENSEAKYHTLFQSMDQGYCTLEVLFEGERCVDYRYMETNPTFERHLGMSNALGKTIREIAPGIEPKWFNIYGGVVLTGQAIRIEEESKAFNKWFEVYAIRIGSAEERKVGVFFTDITERKRTEEVLRGSEIRFRNMIDQAPVAIALTRGMDVIIETINAPMLRMMNKQSKDEVLGKKMLEVLPELEGQPALQVVLNVQKTGIAFRGDEQPVDLLVDEELRRYYFNFSYTPIMEGDSVSGVLHVAIDVTEQVLARKKIEESESRFRMLADESPMFVFIIDVDPLAPVSYWNKTWLTYTGQTYKNALGRAWNGILHEDDIPVVMQHYQPAFEKREPYFIPAVRVRRVDGEYRWHAFKGNPRYLANGDFNGYVGMGFDIHEQKLTQQQLETALEQARLSKEAAELGTFDLDLEKVIMHWDDRCRTLFGISHHEPVTYERDFVNGLHPDDRERILEVIDKAFIKNVSNGDYDVEYRTVGAEDGVIRWIRAKGKVYFDIGQKPVRFIGSVLDITEQVTTIQQIESLVEERTRQLAQANESLLQINRELQRSNANLEEFTYAASHDLKEPIRKISIFSQQLKAQLTNRLKENESQLFARISNSTERMGNLIDDLLLYSHVTQRPHETEAIDLNQKLQRVLEDLELDIEEKNAVIHVGRLPVVNGYRRQLQQLFQNLLSNALKYSRANVPPSINISATEITEHGKPYNMITIKDNGIGFEQHYADKIFHIFTRLHGKAEYNGTGVGLSIVKKVVENHNGIIRVESTPGAGSTFRVLLPAK